MKKLQYGDKVKTRDLGFEGTYKGLTKKGHEIDMDNDEKVFTRLPPLKK